jgi:hypothetical protein
MASSDWILPLYFLSFCFVSNIVMKSFSMAARPRENRSLPLSFWLSPFCSIDTWKKVRPASPGDAKRLWRKFAVAATAFGFAYLYYRRLIARLEPSLLFKSYLAVLPFYLLTECVGAFVQLLVFAFGHWLPPTHANPIASRGLSEFWARRWNPWVAEWFKQVLFPRWEKRPLIGIAAIFAFSGLWHEVLINLPLYLVRKIPLFGTMTLYFGIQGVGVILDKRLLKGGPAFLRIFFLWLVVILPVPLFLNEASLRMFLLY